MATLCFMSKMFSFQMEWIQLGISNEAVYSTPALRYITGRGYRAEGDMGGK